ncbi:hypothetical protein DFH08DRAFT_35372 [Mycena albidolilacea]|uniref:F-box domain-containing protein n=1 Tax=Mycena albidolilacea TaxID=1033008 RepID=A0AAD7F7A1_9AGAR|nr:hypothetical protein DFH08DRAFT_35372 [Mycena albidolilacea]
MAPSTNGIRKLGLYDLVEDVLILILVESDVPGVVALSKTSKFFHRIAFTTAVWYTLVARLVQRGFIDSRPDDGYFEKLSTEQLIGLVKRMLHGPKAWTDTPPQSEHFAVPRGQTIVGRAVNKLRKFIRKPPLGGLSSALPVESRRIALHPEIDKDPDGSWMFNRPELLPGGKYALFLNSGCVECWSVFEDRHIWTHAPSMDHTSVHDFEVDMMEDDIATILTRQRTNLGQHFVEITTLDLKTRISDTELVSRLPECRDGSAYVDCVVCGDAVAVHLRLDFQVVLINWRTSSRVVVSIPSMYDCQIALVPDHLLVLTRTETRGENRVALSPFALFECWEPNDSVEQPLTPVVPVADLPFLADTLSLTCEPSHTWFRSIWVYESPFERGRFTVWLHDLVNGEPAVLSFEFVKHATQVSWRFLSSTVMPAQIYPTTMSLSGHALGRCRGYDKVGIFPPLSVAKDSAQRQIMDLGGSPFVHMSSFSGALTYSTKAELVILYYD